MKNNLLRRLTVLQNEAAQTPVPRRKYFHVGKPEHVPDVGECVPMLSFVEDNLSRFIVSDTASSAWGNGCWLFALPNLAVQAKDGIFLITSEGENESRPHPSGTGQMHFVHLGLKESLVARGLRRLYIYRLDGVQVAGLLK
jgi:hypothetical protein